MAVKVISEHFEEHVAFFEILDLVDDGAFIDTLLGLGGKVKAQRRVCERALNKKGIA